MLTRRRLSPSSVLHCCRRGYASKWPPVPPIEGVRHNLEIPPDKLDTPHLIEGAKFEGVNALFSWFRPIDSAANVHEVRYSTLRPFADTIVPLEYTGPDPQDATKTQFKRFDAPLGVFLDYLESPPAHMHLYLAQCSIAGLPKEMQRMLPDPPFVAQHSLKTSLYYRNRQGNGLQIKDHPKKRVPMVHNTSIWIGIPPTYTPLHRDPLPNCFFQMAGRKTIRLFPPDVGLEIFQRVKRRIGEGEGDLRGRIRGEEMMMGREKEELEKEVWNTEYDESSRGLQARLDRGYGLYIPRGWWHSVKGESRGGR